VAVAKKFLKDMSKPFEAKHQEGISTWSIDDLKRHQKKRREMDIRELQEAELQAAEMEGVAGDQNGRVEEDFGMDEDDEQAMMELDV
jgi:DNA excision repair protein ERCC-2